MTRIRRINVSQVEGGSADNTDIGQIRPGGETAFYIGDNNKLTLMMFDGVRTHQKSKVLSPGVLFGSNADAGDGSTADTIKLIPDAALGSDQYIVVDPTGGEPGHIHLRAGGTQDASTADLYLGGELTCVRVSDTSDIVTIRTTQSGDPAITKEWQFSPDGNLYLPTTGSNYSIGESEPGLVLSSSQGIAFLTNSMANIAETKDLIFDNDGKLRLNGAEVDATSPRVQVGSIINVPLNAAGDTVDYTSGASVIEVPTNADTDLVQAGWIITFNGGVQRTVSSRAVAGGYTSIYFSEANPGGTLYPLTIQSADFVAGAEGAIKLTPDPFVENPKTWTFSETGNLTLPNNAVIRTDGSNVEVGSVTNFNVEAAGVVNIYTDDGTHQWQFGDDGSLTVPGAITQGDAKLLFNENNSTNVYLTPTTDDTSAVFINAVGSQVYGKETVSILGGAGVQAALDLFLENRQLLRDLFDQLQGEPGFPWGITQPAGGDTYNQLLSLPADTFPNQATAIARANSLNQAYSTYQNLYDNSEVTLAVGDKSWRIDSEGFLNAPNQRFIRFYDEQGAFNGAIGGDNLDHVVFAAGTNKGIKVFTDDGTKLWTFGTDGSLTLPAGGDILDSNGASVLGGGGGDATGVSRSDDNLIIRLTDPENDGLELRSILVNGNDLNVASTVLSANGFVISTNSNVSQKQWQFGNDGGLTFPDTTVQTTAFTGTGAITFTANEIEGNTFGGTGTLLTKTVDNTGNDFSTGSGSIGFLNFGADGDIQNVQAGWIVTFASGATRTVSLDAWQPLGTYWNISFDSAYTWSAGDVMPVTFSSPDYAAGTDPEVTLAAGTKSWAFDNNGTLTFPGGMTIETAYGGGPRLVIDGQSNIVDIRSNGNILIGYNSSGNVFIGNPNGGDQVDIVGSRFRVLADVPTASTGAAGDQAGQVAFNGSYIYYCTANYTDGLSNIWKRVAWSGDTW